MYVVVHDWMMAMPLGRTELLIYAYIADLTKHGKVYDGSVKHLAGLMQCSERMVKKALKTLTDAGHLTRVKRGRRYAYAGTPVPEKGNHSSPTKGTTVPSEREPQFPEPGTPVPSPFYIEQSRDIQENKQVHNQSTWPPTIDTIKSYCQEKGLKYLDPEAFFDYYQARDWSTETGPIRDWRRIVAAWNDNAKKAKGKNDAVRSYTLDPDELDQEQGTSYAKVEGDDLPF